MMEIINLVASLLILAFLLYVVALLSYSMFRGAPYAVVGKKRLATIIELLQIQPGQKIADLGSGDGRIVIACAERGAKARGYEINPLLVGISRIKINKSGVKNAQILQKDYWRADLSECDSITLYGVTYMMGRLEKKLQKELRPGSRVVSNHFKFPTLKILMSKNDVHLYVIKKDT